MSTWLRGALGACCWLVSGFAQAQADARTEMPYAALYRVLAPAQAAVGVPRVTVREYLVSKLPNVRAEQIRLVIHSRDGERVVTPNADGSVSFPLERALFDENPMVESNQPRGSLSIGVSLELTRPAGRRWQAAELLAGLADAERVLQASAPASGPLGPIRGVEIYFARDSEAQLTVRGTGERLFLPDEVGRIVLMRDAELAEPDAWLEMSIEPIRAQPHLQ